MMTVSLYNCGHCKLPQLVGQRCHCRTPEDEAFDELAKKQGAWGGGFQAKRAAAADKLQDGKCKLCVDGCEACDARAQPAQEPAQKYLACIRSLTDQCAALIWEQEELQKQVWRYEKNGVTCQTYGHKIDSSCSECNVHENYTTPPKRPWVGLTDDELYETVRAEGRVTKADAWHIVENLKAKLKEKNT